MFLSRKKIWFSSFLLPLLIFFIGLSFTIFFFLEAQRNAINSATHYFERTASLRAEIVLDKLRSVVTSFDGLWRFYEESEFVSKHEFDNYTKPFSSESDIILKTFWMSRVPQTERGPFEDVWSKELGSFGIHDLTPNGHTPVAASRDIYYPITLISPLTDPDKVYLGLDMGAHLPMKSIFDKAAQTPDQVFLFPSPWSFDKNVDGSYLLIAAVRASNEDHNSPSRTIIGYIGMIISPQGIIKESLEYPIPSGSTLKLYDISFSPETLLFETPAISKNTPGFFDFMYPHPATHKQELPLLDRKFLIVIEASVAFLASFFSPTYWLFLPLGIMLSFLFALYIRRVSLQKVTMERFADEQTKDLQEKEHQLTTTLQSIGDALITTDISGRITRINKVSEQMTGWDAPSAIGRPLKEVLHVINEITRMPLADPAEKVLKEGMIISMVEHTILVARDGREFSIDASAAPILDENKKIIGVVLVFRDVTEKRISLNALADNERKFRTFFANMNEGVAMHRIIYGRNGIPVNYIITDVNPRYEEILGISREKVIGKLATEVYGTPQPPYLKEFTRPSETGQAESMSIYFQPMDKYFNISVISYAPSTFATVFTDVTSTRQKEDVIKKTMERLERASEAGKIALWEWDIINNTLAWSDFVDPMLGFKPGGAAQNTGGLGRKDPSG